MPNEPRLPPPTDSDSSGLPTAPPFDIYSFGTQRPMADLLAHPEVEAVEQGAQITVEPATLDIVVGSGGPLADSAAQIYVHVPVPSSVTLECTATLTSLPAGFATVARTHAFVGIFDATGPVLGLFLSKAGMAYSGSCHVASSGDLVLDGPLQPLAGSDALFDEGDVVTFRLAVDEATSTAYIYVTRNVEVGTFGHRLRYVLPALSAAAMASLPPNQTMLSVRGSASTPVTLILHELGLGHGLVIPNLPPRADAGPDQAVRTCTIAQLDGTGSFDPEGVPLLYAWRLIDAPPTSQYVIQGTDGVPAISPSGFTDRLYSSTVGESHTVDPIATGDVLLLGGVPYAIRDAGTDGGGFFLRVNGNVIPDNLARPSTFKILRQRGVAAPTTAAPTFYPDAPGLYKFDLSVFDGGAYSAPAVTVLNVTESPFPRGLIPDVRFLWNALSDFWSLVEGTERIETYWTGLAQAAAAELLNLWQLEYSKSLRDIQRTTQRRWLHYELELHEALPELTAFRPVWSGLQSLDCPSTGILGAEGTHLDLLLGQSTVPFIVPIQATSAISPHALAAQIQAALAHVDGRLSVRNLVRRSSNVVRLRIDAPYSIRVAASSTAPFFSIGAGNNLPAGQGGAINARSYRVDQSLEGLGIAEGDFLTLGDVAYRIARVVDDPSDPWPFQRVTLLDTVPIPAPTSWAIAGQIASTTIDFWTALVTAGDVATVDVVATDRTSVAFSLPVLGASAQSPNRLAVDLSAVGTYIAQAPAFGVFFRSLSRRTLLPRDPLVVDVPCLQERIRPSDDSEVLRRNVDYFLEQRRGLPCLRFVTGTAPAPDVWQHGAAPGRLWAETTYFDNRPTIEANFGIPAGFTLDDLSTLPATVDYLSSVRGLWYAYANGPTVHNLRIGVQILLGLPFAEEAGTIEEIRTDFSATQGRILVRDLASTEIVRSYSFPRSLPVALNPRTNTRYARGDVVESLAPLVEGVEVLDYVKAPSWFRGYVQQGAFHEVEKFFTFLVRVDAAAFNLSSLLFVRAFVLRVKPTYTKPLFVVFRPVSDAEVEVLDTVLARGRLLLDMGVCELTAWADTMFDQPRPAGGGWKSEYDQRPLALGSPSPYPTPSAPITWAFDKGMLCPDYDILGIARVTFPQPTPPAYDSIFEFDMPLQSSQGANVPWAFDTPIPAGTYSVHKTM
ncbi:hypothetical protein LVJ94_34565 [Pendulispora rubella]|uniref:Uncharacterized protein n=1 Tax=Pendulispora rubella TaxID=2741070 RepID=A0ABZ2KW79_9BACT